MAEKTDSLKYRGAHIPAYAQKAITQHMEKTTMPSHLKKYQQGGYIPKHAEKAISQHLQKTLPNHLKKHADPYLQNHVMWKNNARSLAPPTQTSAYPSQTMVTPVRSFEQKNLAPNNQNASDSPPTQPSGDNSNYQQPAPVQQNNGNYDFIMNPPTSNNNSMFMAPQSTTMRIIIFAAGIVLLIILLSVFFSFLNAAGNKQKENLLEVAKTQQEIIRIADLSNEFIADRDLKYKAKTLRAVVTTSHQETIAALAARGEEANPKELQKSQNPQNDAALENARAQARGDEGLNEVFVQLLGQYATQLQAVYDEGNESEKALATDAFNQIDLIFDLNQEASSEDQQPATQ